LLKFSNSDCISFSVSHYLSISLTHIKMSINNSEENSLLLSPTPKPLASHIKLMFGNFSTPTGHQTVETLDFRLRQHRLTTSQNIHHLVQYEEVFQLFYHKMNLYRKVVHSCFYSLSPLLRCLMIYIFLMNFHFISRIGKFVVEKFYLITFSSASPRECGRCGALPFVVYTNLLMKIN
jgi:hypothetical protein